MSTVNEDVILKDRRTNAAVVLAEFEPEPLAGVDGAGNAPGKSLPTPVLPWASIWVDSFLAAYGVTGDAELRRVSATILAHGAGEPGALIVSARRALAEDGRSGAGPAGVPVETPGVMPLQNIDPPWRRETALPWPLRTLGHFCIGLAALLLAIARNDV